MSEQAPIGLRERKKRKLRELIQSTAVGLFVEQGYAETTMEQIAAAAEIAPRTLYRYFPTKDALVVTDDDDQRLIEQFLAELADHPPVEALRRSLRAVMFDQASEVQEQRGAIIAAEPELQVAALRHAIGLAERYADAIVQRSGRPDERDLALSFSGAVVGVSLVALRWDASEDLRTKLERLDTGLAGLEHGFTFHRGP